MKLVVAKSQELPFVITKNNATYTFLPVAEVPDALGAALIKTYPHLYKEATGKETADGYKFKETFKKQAVIDMFAALTDEEKGKVVEFIGKMHTAREENAGDAEGKYDDLKVPELKALISERKIETTATSKSGLVAALEAADKAAQENA
jgi:hypothetical protein